MKNKYRLSWWKKLSNRFHEWNANRPGNKGKGYCYTRYPTPEEAWQQCMQTDPTKEVRDKVHRAFRMVVKYDPKEDRFWQTNNSGRLKRIKPENGMRRPFIGFVCDKCGVAGQFNLFDIPDKGSYCYPDAYKELV